MSRALLETVEEFGFANVDGVEDLSPTRYRWYLEALIDRQERKEQQIEREKRRAG